MAWAVLYMGHSAMRLSAPAFLFGIGVAFILLEGSARGRRMRGTGSGTSAGSAFVGGSPADRRVPEA
jgi:hypothetical protein